jgi:hypothetical protein
MKYFTCTVKVQREVDNGKTKTYTERFLVNAMSVTEAEARVYKFMESAGESAYKVAAVNESRILDVIE